MNAAAGTGGDSKLLTLLRKRFRHWINSRIPPSRVVTLNQRRIFIFPSKVGLFFGVCLLVMLLAAINFQSNLSYGLTFLLATLFIVAVLHTYANLSALTVRAVHARPAFPGQLTEFELQLERSRQKEHIGLYLKWPDSDARTVSLVDEDQVRVQLHAPVGRQRGWFNPGRLLLESSYPLGLLRCWSWIDLDLHALVYPRPLPSPELPGLAAETPDGAAVPVEGSDDFYGFRDYRQGDSLRHIYWKGLARGQSVQVKQYAAYADRSVWLDWEMFPGLGAEQRLSHLCFWALEFDRAGDEYGLRLPGVTIAPDCSERHREQVLRALALHGLEDRS
ncbi:DUF58 domain-containing protein [Seongchinamella unica]|uniref:DUF58 domain-containing protein n=1 Tax=Seongchinamella unica TaxID=2547392 RepID=A0A4R5LS35_9GAMM|nr:DUF58 domain-containing protein [Seongchinamella unica]TDG13713.1 DUF58 domain-containing protein [Seongchinamella unica]